MEEQKTSNTHTRKCAMKSMRGAPAPRPDIGGAAAATERATAAGATAPARAAAGATALLH